MVTKKTWYCHMFRTQGGDFGFPYHNPESKINENRELSRKLFQHDGWPKAIHKFQWLLDKFAPVPEWETPTKEIIYYTCNTHKPEIDNMCREQLLKARLPIVSVSLNKDLDFGNTRLRIDGEKGPLMMHKQILMGLKASKADVVFLTESDVLYPPEHFKFNPERKDVFYFDTNVWKLRWTDGHCVWTDDLQQLSGMCVYRELLTEFFEKRIEQIEKEGFNRHFEPSPRQSIFKEEPDGKYSNVNYQSEKPMVCIRHDANITASKWSVDDYRNKEFAKGWTEAESIPFWGLGKDLIQCKF
jgi:hypothetical protein